MPTEERESAGRLVVVEVDLADLDGDAVCEDLGLCPALRPRRKSRGRVEEKRELGPAFLVVSVRSRRSLG